MEYYIDNNIAVDLSKAVVLYDNDETGDARVELWTAEGYFWAKTNGGPFLLLEGEEQEFAELLGVSLDTLRQLITTPRVLWVSEPIGHYPGHVHVDVLTEDGELNEGLIVFLDSRCYRDDLTLDRAAVLEHVNRALGFRPGYQITILPSTGGVIHFQGRHQGWDEQYGTVYPTVAEAEAALEDAFASIYAKGFTWFAGDRPEVRIEKTGEEGGIV